jgi:hypothetical protein
MMNAFLAVSSARFSYDTLFLALSLSLSLSLSLFLTHLHSSHADPLLISSSYIVGLFPTQTTAIEWPLLQHVALTELSYDCALYYPTCTLLCSLYRVAAGSREVGSHRSQLFKDQHKPVFLSLIRDLASS